VCNYQLSNLQLHKIAYRTTFLKLRKALLNLLKPACYVMHHQFNIQQLYALPTLYLGFFVFI